MIDRLVCADGGNPDPTLTHGKDAQMAKEIELDGWDYPRHLDGRLVLGGRPRRRRGRRDWCRSSSRTGSTSWSLRPAGPKAELDRYIGYWKPYATSHDELDADLADPGRGAQRRATLCEAVKAKRDGKMIAAGQTLDEPRQK